MSASGPEAHATEASRCLTINLNTNFFGSLPGQIVVQGYVFVKGSTNRIAFYPRIALMANDSSTKVSSLRGTVMKEVYADKTKGPFLAEPGKTNFFFGVAGGYAKGHSQTIYSGRGNVYIYATSGEDDLLDQRISNLIIADVDFDHRTVASVSSQP